MKSPQKPIPRVSPKKASKGFQWSTAKRSKIKKKPRSKSERERIYGPKGYVEWLHEQPCVGCGVVGYSECAHIENGGMGRKADWTRTVPLCGPHSDDLIESLPVMGCHRWSHLFGLGSIPDFDAEKAAAETQAAWIAHSQEKA